jgi:4-hydroxy-2-oxoheptanedioate aldolase
MKKLTNSFKTRLLAGETQYGYWLAMANAYTAEIAATCGFDWLLIDGEHGPNDVRSILAQLQAVAPYPVSPIVRAVEGTTANIKQLLDIGAHNLLIPMIESAEQASNMVAATRYPPTGNRGVGAAIARSSRWLAIENYAADIEENICLILQIESQKGIDNLDEILEVSGYDAIFIGPSDLAASMGYSGQTDHKKVQQAISIASDKIKAAGKGIGTLSTEPSMIKTYANLGATFIAIGVDTLSYAESARNLAKQYIK